MNKMNILQAPVRPIPYLAEAPRPWVFLAGSIEMGAAIDWQAEIANRLKHLNGTLFNPRRSEWDASWGPGHPELIRQINWELDFLERANIIVMYLDPSTKSPISLLELGLNSNARLSDMLVCCPDGFYRKTNVEVVCNRYKIPLFQTFEELVSGLVGALVE